MLKLDKQDRIHIPQNLLELSQVQTKRLKLYLISDNKIGVCDFNYNIKELPCLGTVSLNSNSKICIPTYIMHMLDIPKSCEYKIYFLNDMLTIDFNLSKNKRV